MATRKIIIKGQNHAVNSAITVTFAGVEISSGAVSTEVIDESDVWSAIRPIDINRDELVEFEYNNADDTQETEHSLRIEVTAGQIRVGNIRVEATRDAAIANSYPVSTKIIAVELGVDGVYYYPFGDGSVYGDNSESALSERTNILINDAEPISVGYEGNYAGHTFLLSAGDTFACTVRVPATLSTYS